MKIRTLAEAGVPLVRVKDLLAAGVQEFAAAIAEIDCDLRRQAEKIRRWYAARYPAGEPGADVDPAITRLAAASVGASSPAWTRLAELARSGG